jgi:DNA-directed RNA polymerase subunit E'/Rpb7
MFREVELTHTIRMSPANLSVGLRERIVTELHRTVEGLVTSETGIILLITQVVTTGAGRVSERTGFVLFDVVYRALVCCPQGGQVIDGIITSVTHQGIRLEAGPVEVFVAKRSIPSHFQYDQDCRWLSTSGQPQSLQHGVIVRVKIINVAPTTELTKLSGAGTLLGNGLGILGSAAI